MQARHSFTNRSSRARLGGAWLSVLLFLLLAHGAKPARAESDSFVFLPIIGGVGEAASPNLFNPQTDTTLPGGEQTFDELNIPAGVTVTVQDALKLTVHGNATIAGALVGDCVAVHLTAGGDLTITGVVDNQCSDPDASDPGALQLYAHGSLFAGTLETEATLRTSGDLDLSNDPATPLWHYDVLPEQRAGEPLAPVCAATADTLWETALPDAPAQIRFSGEGADPNGGPVTFRWDFGDGSPTADGPEVTHSYPTPGAYVATLTVTDEDGEQCAATLALNIDDGETPPTAPAVSIQPTDLVVVVGETLTFAATVADPQEGELTYAWRFGDTASSTILTATHAYAAPGRYLVDLTVTGENGASRLASAAVYVYEPPSEAAAMDAPLAFCPPNPLPPRAFVVNQGHINNLPQAAPGRNGRNQTYRGRGLIIIAPGVMIQGQHGGDGANRAGVGTVRGQHGGRGGSIDILVDGRLVVCAGVSIAAGDGGDGGNATATAPPGATARAFGGRGGDAARRLRLLATRGIDFEGPVTVNPGSGGDGGVGDATGDPGRDRCTVAEQGAHALGVGAGGGNASKFVWRRGRVVGIGNVTIVGGLGGDGGDGLATGGKGGNATCPTNATGGHGGRAEGRGGQGGHARLTGAAAAGVVVSPAAFVAGDGGQARVTAGAGGSAVATPSAACESTMATGGVGNRARAVAGHGGKGRIDGEGGEGHARSGNGGNATATGGDCTACNNGGNATATAGDGGSALARSGRPRPVGDGTTATAGNGGVGTARGGKGGDCPTCPGGKGGDGGVAAATGGAGGHASGSSARNGGDGGLGDALGGNGGKGADCCNPPQAGGNGGKGGDATSRAGNGGSPGGAVGGNLQKAGDGGNGGEGEGPGAGGPGGVGTGIPFPILDGLPGNGGPRCPVTVTPTPTPTETTPAPDPTPVITGVRVTSSVTQTTPSQTVALTAELEGAHLPLVDSFFDVFFIVSSRSVISDRVPTTSDGAGGYHAAWQFNPAGEYIVDAIAIHKETGNPVAGVRNPQPVHSSPIPIELAQLELTSMAPGSLPGMASTLLLTGLDQFGNAIPHVPAGSIQCSTDDPAIQLGAPAPLPGDFFDLRTPGAPPLPVHEFLGVTVTGAGYGVADATCVHASSGASASLPVAFAPWRLTFGSPASGPGAGFAVDSFFDITYEIRLPADGGEGWRMAAGQLAWPSEAPIEFAGCEPKLDSIDVICQQPATGNGPRTVNFQIFTEGPMVGDAAPLGLRFKTGAAISTEAVESTMTVVELLLTTESTPVAYDPALFGPTWRSHPFAIKPFRSFTLHIYRVEGAATTADLDADVAQAQQAFNLNGLICACPFFIRFDVISTTIPITDWRQIEPTGDGLDRDAINAAKAEGHFTGSGNTASIYYAPGIRGGALGMTYAPDGQAAVDNSRDHDGWTLFHELVHVLDLKKDGKFDVRDSPDDSNNEQGARNPLNAMNYANMGPFLTPQQCKEL